MALTSKSIDEILTLMADTFDGLITPKSIFRNNNNKLWLIFRGIAAGYAVIQDAILALHSRFDPANCADEDLYSTAKLVGTEFKDGSGSLLRITVTNTSTSAAKTLAAGVYKYVSVSGDVFTFELTLNVSILALGTKQVTAISAEYGSFKVSAIADIGITRVDEASIDAAFSFACTDNSAILGYTAETAWDFRQRILSDTDRQDAVKELELAIRNLPNILECNIVLNQTVAAVTYDGVSVGPHQMLITITGSPGTELAELVASSTIFSTKMVEPENVLYVYDTHYINGMYPIYYTTHKYSDFSLVIDYRFDSTKAVEINVESAMQAALSAYKLSATHIDTLTEEDIYTLIGNLNLTSVKVLNVDILVGGVSVSYIDVPKTRMLNLVTATLNGTDISQ